MKKRDYILLAGFGWLVSLVWAGALGAPGFMDADYYFAAGRQLASGAGLWEPFLWNFLGDPANLPIPAFGYWMPLAGLLASAGMFVSGRLAFWAAQAGFVLVAGLLPPLTARITIELAANEENQRWQAWLAGLFALAPGFYAPFLGTTDTFGLYMLLGGLFCLLVIRQSTRSSFFAAFTLGMVCAGLHLARADGGLWLGVACLAAIWPRKQVERQSGFAWLALLIAGYLALMGPWFLRNWWVLGVPLAPGGSRVLWLTGYDELYSYPAQMLTFERWWGRGLPALLQDRMWALGQNLQTALAVQGMVFAAPLMLVGLWHRRAHPAVRWGVLGWLATLGLMTLVFPFAGARGGFFHSGAALQPLLWASLPAGLVTVVSRAATYRNWQLDQALKVFGGGCLALAIMLTLLTGAGRLPRWDTAWKAYQEMDAALARRGIGKQVIVMANNPPGYYAVNLRPAVVVPNGDVNTLLQAAARYRVGYIWLEANHPAGLADLYTQPGDRPGLMYLETIGKTHLYRVVLE